MISSRCIFITLFIITLVNLSCIPIANAGLFGGGKKKEEEKKAKEAMQDSVYAGMEQMKHVMNDKDALLEAGINIFFATNTKTISKTPIPLCSLQT